MEYRQELGFNEYEGGTGSPYSDQLPDQCSTAMYTRYAVSLKTVKIGL